MDLTERQHVKLAWLATTDPKLYRACLLKDGLRTILQVPYDDAVEALDSGSAGSVAAASPRSPNWPAT